MIDVPAPEFEAFVERIRDAYGFVVDVAHNALMGRCGRHEVGRPAATVGPPQ